jgi:hypothetical protein
MADTAAGPPNDADLLRLILAKVERFEDVMSGILRGLEREVDDRKADVRSERRRRRWGLVVVAVFAAALLALGAVQVRVMRDQRAHDVHQECLAANSSREAIRQSISRVFVLIGQVSPSRSHAVIDGLRRQIDADLAAHLPVRDC